MIDEIFKNRKKVIKLDNNKIENNNKIEKENEITEAKIRWNKNI